MEDCIDRWVDGWMKMAELLQHRELWNWSCYTCQYFSWATPGPLVGQGLDWNLLLREEARAKAISRYSVLGGRGAPAI